MNRRALHGAALVALAWTAAPGPARAQDCRGKVHAGAGPEWQPIWEAARAHRVPGVAVALVLVGDGPGAAGENSASPRLAIELGSYGCARLEQALPMLPSTPVRAGSVSKLLTSLLLLRAVESGAVGLDEPVALLAPDFAPAHRAPTLAELMEHTAGLADLDHRALADLRAPDWRDYPRPPRRPRWPPGFYFSYSSWGHTFAARWLELRLQRDFETEMGERVLLPLGMPGARFAADPPADVAWSYTGDGRTRARAWRVPVVPAGGLVASTQELARVVALLLGRGALGAQRFLSADTVLRMETPTTSAAARAGQRRGGYALGVFEFAVGAQRFLGHWGRIDGFQTTVGYDPERGAGFVLVLNSGDRAAAAALRAAVTARFPARAAAPRADATTVVPAPPASAPLPPGPGFYQPFTDGLPLRAWLFETFGTIHVGVEPGRLRTRSLLGGGRVFRAEGAGYRAEDLPVPTLSFVRGHDGGKVLVDGESFRRVPWARAIGQPLLTVVPLLLGLFYAGKGGLALVTRRLRRAPRPVARPSGAARAAAAGARLALVAHAFVLVAYVGGSFGEALGRPSALALALLVASLVGPASALLALGGAGFAPAPGRIGLALAAAAGWVWLGVCGWVPLCTFR